MIPESKACDLRESAGRPHRTPALWLGRVVGGKRLRKEA
jgi:hypothetical protein